MYLYISHYYSYDSLIVSCPCTKQSNNNRWTSPRLDEDKKAIENDDVLKLAVLKLKNKFITETQALLHGNLHTGSVLVSPRKTFDIGPKCSFYGPMGYDTGAIIANLLLNYVSQTVLSSRTDNIIYSNNNYAEWVLSEVNSFWDTFREEFLKLWNDPNEHTGDAFQRALLHKNNSTSMPLHFAKEEFMSNLLEDTLGFAGVEMLRRLVGTAHVEDLECIGDIELRAQCERHGLEIAKELIKNASMFKSMNIVTMMACDKQCLHWGLSNGQPGERIEEDEGVFIGSTFDEKPNLGKQPIKDTILDEELATISFSDDEDHCCNAIGPVEF